MSRIASEVRVNERQGMFLMGPSRSLQELCGAVAASAANVHAGFGLVPSSSGAHPEKEIVMEWYLATFRKYFDFNGRARRKEYWIFTLINFPLESTPPVTSPAIDTAPMSIRDSMIPDVVSRPR